jgi:hypothetical protein
MEHVVPDASVTVQFPSAPLDGAITVQEGVTHALCPVRVLSEPAGQGVHAVTLTLPVTELDVPLGHGS